MLALLEIAPPTQTREALAIFLECGDLAPLRLCAERTVANAAFESSLPVVGRVTSTETGRSARPTRCLPVLPGAYPSKPAKRSQPHNS